MKRVISLILCLIMCNSLLFAGCARNSDTDEKEGTDPVTETKEKSDDGKFEYSEPGVFPIVNEKITLKFTAPQHHQIKDIRTNEFTKWYEEKTNVHIEWELVPWQSRVEKKGLLLASGDYSGILFNMELQPEDEMIYGPQGVFTPLNDLIEAHGVEIKKMFDAVDYIEKGITTPDGNIYTLPQVNECYHCIYAQKMWINQDWMDKLGLETPKTTDEFYEVLKAFKTQDPNGNGKTDELPLTGSPKGWHSNPYNFLMNAFIFSDGGNQLRVVNGKVDLVADEPEFKEGLSYIAKLFKEGLIDPGAFTQDGEQLKQLGENPEAVVIGAVPAGWMGVFTSLEGERHKMYQAITPIKGPKGVQTCGYYPFTYSTGKFAITDECKHPEIAYKWADWLYSLEAALRYIEAGREGYEWRKAEADELDLRGRPAKWARIDDIKYAEIQNAHYYQMGPSWRSFEYRQSWAQPQDINDSKAFEKKLYEATKLYEPYAPPKAEVYPKTYVDSSVVGDLAQVRTAVNDYIKEAIARFITGDMDIEKDWDRYTENLKNIGLDQYLQILQDAYDAQYAD